MKIKDKNIACVYLHKKPNGEVFYVGIGNTKRPFAKSGRSKYWHKIVNKYGYKVDIILNNLSWEDACKNEIFYISLYGRKDSGKGTLINVTNGGDGGDTRSGKKHSEETKRKISESHKGKPSHFKGKKRGERSEETKIKLSIAGRGKKWSDEHRQKMIGRKWSQKMREKMVGRKHSEERKKQISEAGKKRWEEIRKNPSIMDSWSKNRSSTTFKKGLIVWNKGTKGVMKPNSGSFKKGEHRSIATEFKIAV